jgi:hypothetical protein
MAIPEALSYILISIAPIAKSSTYLFSIYVKEKKERNSSHADKRV